nr:unnamed protein product [Digitaria exilis]
MEATLPLLGLLLLVLFLIKLFVTRHSPASSSRPRKSPAPPLRLPPGPWQLPLIGSLHHLLLSRHGDLIHRTLRDLSRRHGDLMLLRLGSVPTLVVSSAEAAKEVTRTHDAAFASRHLTPTLAVFSVGGRDVLFSPYGELWRQLRRVCVLELLSARRVRSLRRVREEEAAALLRSVAASCSAASGAAVVDVGERICRAMNDTVVRSAIGGRCARRDEFLRELHRAVVLTSGFNLADLYPSSPVARWLSPALREAQRCNRAVRDIMAEIIREQQSSAAAGHEDDDDNLLAVLLRLQRDGDAQCPLTTEIISTVVLEIFAAGSETSSTTLEWALCELTRNPRVMRKAQDEVREAFKGQHRVTEPDTETLRYLPLVVKETLRLHVPVPFLLPRECREPTRVMGHDVPKGTKVLVNAWAIARDGQYWDCPDEFRPERFETAGSGDIGDGGVDFKGGDFEYIPFGAGRRMCPGAAMGVANMALALAGLLYHFDWEVPDVEEGGGDGVGEAFGITVKRKSKLVLRATQRIPCAY